jgi:L-seryl-tRNA(Ser) seleniumtransferase
LKDKNNLLRQIPKVDILLGEFSEIYNKNILKVAIDEVLSDIREKILKENIKTISKNKIIEQIILRYENLFEGSLIPVVNATGIVIHTNLGRSPIQEESFDNIKSIVCGYSNLEYDLKTGVRGERYHHIKKYLNMITGAEDALVVNNNAAAVFLILNTFSKSKETIVSRGELIEIGGSFRIPDVMEGSGAILKEVGTTNKTKGSDYENAVNENSAMIMKVHTSNYKIIGFTEEVEPKNIPEIAEKNNLMSYYDLGSGSIVKTVKNCEEYSIKQMIDSGFDLVSASGDKMLGGPQAGIILGKKQYIDQLKKNPLLRMLRVDKLTLSLLQEVIRNFIMNEYEMVSSFNLLNQPISDIKKRARKLAKLINKEDFSIKISEDKTYVGGGSCPMTEIETVVIYISSEKYTSSKIEKLLRENKPAIIGRIKNDKFLLDLRTVFDNQLNIIANALNKFI